MPKLEFFVQEPSQSRKILHEKNKQNGTSGYWDICELGGINSEEIDSPGYQLWGDWLARVSTLRRLTRRGINSGVSHSSIYKIKSISFGLIFSSSQGSSEVGEVPADLSGDANAEENEDDGDDEAAVQLRSSSSLILGRSCFATAGYLGICRQGGS